MNGISNNITFKGALGEKFVREITINHRTVSANELLQASKGKVMGLDTTKVGDIFEAFTSSLIKETKEKLSMKEHMDKLAQELPQKIQDTIKNTEEAIFSSIRPILERKDKEIEAKDKIIDELRKYESMAKVKSIEELDVIMPKTAILTAQEMKEHSEEARESMLNYLLTGKGQEAVLAQTERNNILMKAMQDGITQLPEVNEAIKGTDCADTLWFLSCLMENALKDKKGSIIVAPVVRQQIKTNIIGLLAPYYDNRYTNTNENGVSKDIDNRLEKIITFHKEQNNII